MGEVRSLWFLRDRLKSATFPQLAADRHSMMTTDDDYGNHVNRYSVDGLRFTVPPRRHRLSDVALA